MYQVNLVSVFHTDNVPDEYRGFVNFQAEREGKELEGKERVAILVVENTESYIPVFVDDLEDIGELEERLERQHARMAPSTRNQILEIMD